jgi:hypothetical protein
MGEDEVTIITSTTSAAAPLTQRLQVLASLAPAQPVSSGWEAEAVRSALALKDLPENWDRPRSQRPTVTAINGALACIGDVAALDFTVAVPFISPMAGGGVQLEWDHAGRRLEIEMLPEGGAAYLLNYGNEIEEGQIQGPLAHAIRTLFFSLMATR